MKKHSICLKKKNLLSSIIHSNVLWAAAPSQIICSVQEQFKGNNTYMLSRTYTTVKNSIPLKIQYDEDYNNFV